MYYEIDSHLESDYEDKYEIEYPSWTEQDDMYDDTEEYDSWDEDETDNEDDPDMYPKDIERDQLDYPHNQHIPSYSD